MFQIIRNTQGMPGPTHIYYFPLDLLFYFLVLLDIFYLQQGRGRWRGRGQGGPMPPWNANHLLNQKREEKEEEPQPKSGGGRIEERKCSYKERRYKA